MEQLSLAKAAMAEGDYVLAVDIYRSMGWNVSDSILELAGKQLSAEVPEGHEARVERYMNRVRVVVQKVGSPKIASEG